MVVLGYLAHPGPQQLKMIFSFRAIRFLAFVMTALLPMSVEARTVTVEFALDPPKSKLEQKIFLDRARLTAQVQMLELYFADVSFALSIVRDPHQGRLESILRNGYYKSSDVTGFENIKRKKINNKWHFVFSGNIPDDPPQISDNDLVEKIQQLVKTQSSLITPEFAIELSLAYPDLNLYASAMKLWRVNYLGHSYAMFPGQNSLSPKNFEFSGRALRAEGIPTELSGIFSLLDEAPFNPYICQTLLPALATKKLPALADALYPNCVVLEKISFYLGRIKIEPKKRNMTRMPSVDMLDGAINEFDNLKATNTLDNDTWLTHLIINSFGTVPASFELGEQNLATESSEIILESLEFEDESKTILQIEKLEEIELSEAFQSFEQAPTITAMRELSDMLNEAGYPVISEIFKLQASNSKRKK
ncbi:hypothetical protein SAR116_1683 [Candidatus Puniceispirillum marinum IMCC1322]|uniref:Uncharacterized protein n=1 Tax=Puniceispirillum marinum (strain IMCC1322) TaxID=488538 RepID=D5BUH9_PUNMI|nr:hypothetical protein SAR116_1683 [Candidatus Puniceispirillum marinum IMCC1322]